MRIVKILFTIMALLLQCPFIQAQIVEKEVRRDTTLLANKDTIINIQYEVKSHSDTVFLNRNSNRYYSNRRQDNWFAGGSMGIQKYCGEEDNNHGMANITPAFRIYAGKWLLPFIAFRVNLAYQKAKGYTSRPDISNYIVGGIDSKGLYTQKWDYFSYGADVMLSINDAISYRPDRKGRVILFAGASMNQSLKECNNSEAKRSASFDCGIEYRYRFARNWDFAIGGRMNIYNKSFDDEQTRHYFEYGLGIDVGVTWYLRGKKSGNEPWKRNLQKTINTNTTYRNAEELHRYCQTETGDYFVHPAAVFFIINKWDVRSEYEFTLKSTANDIKRTKARFVLYGSADKATGNDSINTRLAINRCQSVFDKLVNDYGVNPDQLIQKPQGGVDIYHTGHLNRCVIIVQDDERSIKAIEELNNQKKF